jgi:2,3-bisphosphoglycerate-dependent phosphoglycerate mutase
MARLLVEGGYNVDIFFTSRLKRVMRSSWILLRELKEVHLPVFKSWRLNKPMYGVLTGLSKSEIAMKLGNGLVQEWHGGRRGGKVIAPACRSYVN